MWLGPDDAIALQELDGLRKLELQLPGDLGKHKADRLLALRIEKALGRIDARRA